MGQATAEASSEPSDQLIPTDVLSGGGEMGARTRAFDWAATPLGPVAQWPQSLKTIVSTCLNSRFPIVLWWGRELITLYNDAYAPMLAAKHPGALGRTGRDVWPEIWPIIGPMLDGVMTRGEATWSDDQMLPLRRHGYTEECYFTFTYSPIRDESGGVGGVFCAVIETTERVIGARRLAALRELGAKTAAEARTAEDACRTAAQILDGCASDVPFALLYLLDDAGKTARLAGISGLQVGTAASREHLAIDIADPLDGWPLARVARTGKPVLVDDLSTRFGALPGGPWPEPAERAMVLPIMRAGQDQHPWGMLIAGVSPRRAFDDDYRGFLQLVAGHIATAVENARAYEEERRRAAALAELDRAKTVFFSNISHEFRTPLSLLLAPVEDMLAERGRPLDATHRAQLEVVHRNGIRLLTLVNALLDFSRIEAGRIDASYEPTDLAAYTTEIASTFRSAIEKAGLRLVVDCPSLGALADAVYVDRAMWEKIVLNLLSNAFKHTFEGEIAVRMRVAGERVMLEVQDTGVGIAADQLPHLFQRFYRVPNARARTHEGSGIGLAFVQELVRLHGGIVDVTSREGAGTTFRVSVPTGSAHLAADRIVAPAASRNNLALRAHVAGEAERWAVAGLGRSHTELVSSTLRGPRGRILLADDNGDVRDYVTRLLADDGWQVVAVADGRAALDSALADTPDLVLADVMMPGLDGFALLRALREDPRTASMPVILLSARAGEEARVEGLRAGADDYVVKPFTARDLTARVTAHVTLAQARERARAEMTAVASRLSTIFAQAPVGIAVMRGPDHVFELVNEQYRKFTGKRNLVGLPVREALPDLAGQGIYELLDGVFTTREPYVGTELRLLVDRAGNGQPEEMFFNFVYQPLLDAEGQTEAIAAVITDVTDLVRARHAAENAQREAEAANRAKSDFLAAMSHELRTPLNAIAGYVQLLDMGVHGPVSPQQREALRRVQKSEQHLLSLINDVLNFAKLETGRVEYHLTEISLGDAVAAVGAMMEPQLEAKGITYEVHVPSHTIVRADEEKLQQILLNLLSNAVKFTEPGGRVVVEVARRANGNGDNGARGRVFLRVTDTGVGIARDKQESIFDPFVQVHRHLTRNTEGTGLGLAISRDLARGMGADLRVRSQEGAGARFTLALATAGT